MLTVYIENEDRSNTYNIPETIEGLNYNMY